MDERKSWKRLIFAYAGAGVLVVAIAFFLARGASQNSGFAARPGSTSTPTVIGVFSGIRADQTAAPAVAAPTDSPSPSPVPTQSATPGPHPSATAQSPEEKKLAAATAAAAAKKAAQEKHAKQILAELPPGALPSKHSADSGHIIPIVHPATEHANDQPVPAASAVTIGSPTEAPAPVATQAPVESKPVAESKPAADSSEAIFAPQRIVDAQVRVAVQPDVSDVDRERGAHGTSVVLVTIDPKGNVVGASVSSSSGYSSLDRDAVVAARASQFVAPKINGHPATETYRVVYDFSQ